LLSLSFADMTTQQQQQLNINTIQQAPSGGSSSRLNDRSSKQASFQYLKNFPPKHRSDGDDKQSKISDGKSDYHV